MATTSEARALPFFTDLIGQPLSSGFIYIGQAGLDPIAYPAVIHSDIAGTVVVAQPVRTTNGHAAAAGSLIHLYVPIPYSITILDSAGRLVYASLNETDPVVLAASSGSVQSAPDLATLRARSRTSTNQVYVDSFGMYVYAAADNTSPESIPSVIVGNDGARYHLSRQYVAANSVNIVAIANPNTPGTWLSFGDGGTGSTYITTNQGGGGGGHILRTVNADASAEVGKVSISATGDLLSTGNITAAGKMVATGNISTSGSVIATGNLTASNSVVNLNALGTRSLGFDGTRYTLPSADLLVNGSVAITQASLADNQLNNRIGAVALGNTTSPQPALPGTWVQTGTAQAGVVLWVRTA